MYNFIIERNQYLQEDTEAFYYTNYLGYENPGNPDYINYLKNTFNKESVAVLESAMNRITDIARGDLMKIHLRFKGELDSNFAVCVVPRAKAQSSYHVNQLGFRESIRNAISDSSLFIDGVDYITRVKDTKTTHLPKHGGNGAMPYVGITLDTCKISDEVRGKNIILVDDIYTKTVDIVEDVIQALYSKGAKKVVFYGIAKTRRRY